MIKKGLKGLFIFIGLILGFLIGVALIRNANFTNFLGISNNFAYKALFLTFSTIIFGFILFLLTPVLNTLIVKLINYIEKSLQRMTVNEIVFGTLGAFIALVITSLVVSLFSTINIFLTLIAVIIDIIMASIGADIAIKKREEILNFIVNIKKGGSLPKDKKGNSGKGDSKILDTSVIIDGRIFDICRTGFVEGTLIIPNFVLEELRHIADSSDSLKRNRGRRGLDILNRIQNELNVDISICEKDFPNIAEVDSKLLKLAQQLNCKVVTNDYNLNKVAEFQGVSVLNINELANSVKPVVLPGEEMIIQIIKDGKESGQGVAYLDDGTMIVVEGGRRHIGEAMGVIVTSVLQTAAGRMIFAKQKDAIDKIG
ncbi:MAG TPA: PIN/TRAM domain-containing protein [Clostridiaceae bacterium]